MAAACCSMVRGGRFGTTRSGNGLVGTFPYLNSVSSDFSPLPVEPTRVTALRFEGEVGALGIKVSALPEVETEAFEGTPKKPSCGTMVTSSMISSWTSSVL